MRKLQKLDTCTSVPLSSRARTSLHEQGLAQDTPARTRGLQSQPLIACTAAFKSALSTLSCVKSCQSFSVRFFEHSRLKRERGVIVPLALLFGHGSP